MIQNEEALYQVYAPLPLPLPQPSIPPGSVNEYQLRLGRQRQVWLIPIADERVGVQVKL